VRDAALAASQATALAANLGELGNRLLLGA
jgi:hypothetical protein